MCSAFSKWMLHWVRRDVQLVGTMPASEPLVNSIYIIFTYTILFLPLPVLSLPHLLHFFLHLTSHFSITLYHLIHYYLNYSFQRDPVLDYVTSLYIIFLVIWILACISKT